LKQPFINSRVLGVEGLGERREADTSANITVTMRRSASRLVQAGSWFPALLPPHGIVAVDDRVAEQGR
jgi:hypothetical protein